MPRQRSFLPLVNVADDNVGDVIVIGEVDADTADLEDGIGVDVILQAPLTGDKCVSVNESPALGTVVS